MDTATILEPSPDRRVAELEAQLLQRDTLIAQLQQRVTELEQRLTELGYENDSRIIKSTSGY